MKYGIDTATINVDVDAVATDIYDGGARSYQTASIDVSSLSGTHSLIFVMDVASDSDTYPAELDGYISEIKLL
jgi:hypothetical protein